MICVFFVCFGVCFYVFLCVYGPSAWNKTDDDDDDDYWSYLVIVLTDANDMLIRRTIIVSLRFIFLAGCETLNFVGIGKRRARVDDHSPLSVDTAGHVSFLNYSFHSINIPSSAWKHLAQTCGSLTVADLQTFYQMSVFNVKTHFFFCSLPSFQWYWGCYLMFPFVSVPHQNYCLLYSQLLCFYIFIYIVHPFLWLSSLASFPVDTAV